MPGAKVKDEDLIGHKFHSNSCNDFTVLRKTNNKTYGDCGNYLYEIEFDEINGIKFRKEVRKEYILKRNIFNPYYPSVYGIGYCGNASLDGHEYEYHKWQKMLSRCYNPKDKKYKNYGAIGVYVCERWKCFEYFLKDFKHIEGYQEGERQSLDKDIKAICEPKYYSLDTCCLVPVEQNVKEMQNRFGITAMTARKDLVDLVAKGYLSEININNVKKGYIKSSQFDEIVLIQAR
jgi:hypothetical protein